MTTHTAFQGVAAALFGLAILHTFSVPYIEKLGHKYPGHAGVFHLLGEVEAVFGVWALILLLLMCVMESASDSIHYLESRNFTEPMFVFAIMVVAASKPILCFAQGIISYLAKLARHPVHRTPASRTLTGREETNPYLADVPSGIAYYFVALFVTPLLGSFITEPAAMTLAAFMLRDTFFSQGISTRLRYATIGVLFVNISVGGVLTPFAAPPVLMVAGKWNWDIAFMMSHYGWRAILAVCFNALAVTWFFRKELYEVHIQPPARKNGEDENGIPLFVTITHLLFLAGVVIFAHHPVVFMGLFLFFLGFATAYKRYQNPLILKEGLMVAFFLAGLVTLGGQQQWWLQDLLMGMDTSSVYFGATALTAVTDNAALTYLGSLVEGLSDEFKYALVAGAVSGGGLTVIANAPNPAGFSILKGHFPKETIRAPLLLLSSLPPTLAVVVAFYFI
jgi:Na+/H+ antiporter NhaD/arsenite permease-like protein